jgi:endoglycosylceramidase
MSFRTGPRAVLAAWVLWVFLSGACSTEGEKRVPTGAPPVPGNECSNDRFITDGQCGALVLHGCNFDGSAKGDSGLPDYGREDALRLSTEWGFNFVRYLIFWARIEPEPGRYDETYLDEVEERLDWMQEAGMRVVLDMHQDLWGPGVREDGESSDGAPEWATLTDGLPHVPFSEWLGGWGFDYLSPDVTRAFDNFWDYDGPHPELQDRYAAMWAHVARRFRDHPALLGYNLMNEPWQGSDLVRARAFDEGKYTDFNQRMIDALREVDTEHWVFYEPCAFGPNQGLPSYLGLLEDPRAGKPRLAYFPHLYPLTVELAGGYDRDTDPSLPLWAEARVAESDRQGAPLLAGEWSMLRWVGLEDRVMFFEDVLRTFERVTAGWAYWDCGFFFREPFPDVVQPMITRPYPRRIAGTPVLRAYDEATGRLVVVFRDDPQTAGPTEIYLGARRNYPGGWRLEVSDPDGTWSSHWDEESSVLRVWTDPAREEHTLQILPSGSP